MGTRPQGGSLILQPQVDDSRLVSGLLASRSQGGTRTSGVGGPGLHHREFRRLAFDMHVRAPIIASLPSPLPGIPAALVPEPVVQDCSSQAEASPRGFQ
mmetsp:Transcript_3932/g.6966  ORF Transcript_3932/g.6966 Transcript_3932/m.6966 type:complete len:99 (+) Transcript_3932:726-1022(+)